MIHLVRKWAKKFSELLIIHDLAIFFQATQKNCNYQSK